VTETVHNTDRLPSEEANPAHDQVPLRALHHRQGALHQEQLVSLLFDRQTDTTRRFGAFWEIGPHGKRLLAIEWRGGESYLSASQMYYDACSELTTVLEKERYVLIFLISPRAAAGCYY
jgi:hypothetical protein